MSELGLPALPTELLSQKKAAPNVADLRTRAQAEQVAQQFERMFIAEMLGPMFEGLETDGPFGGGNAEATFRPMLIDQYAEAIAKGGGVGIAESVLKEILKMQGLE
jgi:flagellar protein FlgJ